MTEPEDHSNTRPISVAELLARNGSIGAPPVGGRRRKRRGNSDSVTVAELTGELPIITDASPAKEFDDHPRAEQPAANGSASHPPVAVAGVVETAPVEPEADVLDDVDELDSDAL